LRLTPSTEWLPWDDLRKILHGGQRMTKIHNGEEILPQVSTPWVGRNRRIRMLQTTDRQQTDLR